MDVIDTNLTYRDSDGVRRKLKGCKLTKDKGGRYWLWSEQLEQNLSYNIKDREDCFISAIDSLLFTIKLKDERITALQRIADLAQEFALAVNPEEYNEDFTN